LLPFTIHANDGIAVQAHADLAIAYNALAGLPFLPANNLSGQNLGGLTLTPRVYRFNTDAALTGPSHSTARATRMQSSSSRSGRLLLRLVARQ